VLVLDADEVLTPEAVERIRPALRDRTKAAFLLPLVNEGESEEETAVYLLRLFRARRSIRFTYRIHEQVAGAVLRFARRNALGVERLENATVRHTGYVPEVVASRDKQSRNRRHFEAQLAWYPQDLYSWYKYADFLRECGRMEDARAAIARAYGLLGPMVPEEIARLPFSGEVVALHVLELVNSDRLDEAWDASRMVAALDLDSAHAWYARGLVAARTGRHEEALEAFRKCRTYDGLTATVPIDPAITGESAPLGEAEALAGLGRTEEARALYLEVMDRHERSARALLGLMQLDQDLERTLADLAARADPVPAATRLTGAEALVILGRTDRAARWLEETGTLDDPAVTSALGEIHLHAGRLEEAERVWSRAPDDPDCRAGAVLAGAILGRDAGAAIDHATATRVRALLVNLRRSGREELFQTAARACVERRLLGGGEAE
jgi:tetratricopeptide (TPR) repeat protein